MEQTKKMSLADLKLKASTIESNEVLEKIQGGMAADCHSPKSFTEKMSNRFYNQVDKAFDSVESWLYNW